jgi:hypothetical protein
MTEQSASMPLAHIECLTQALQRSLALRHVGAQIITCRQITATTTARHSTERQTESMLKTRVNSTFNVCCHGSVISRSRTACTTHKRCGTAPRHIAGAYNPVPHIPPSHLQNCDQLLRRCHGPLCPCDPPEPLLYDFEQCNHDHSQPTKRQQQSVG